MDLFPHNRQAYDAACRLLAETGKAAVIHPTGTGKSFIGFQLCQDRTEDRVCWLSPSEYIWQNQEENLRKVGEALPGNVQFLTYARLMLLTEEERSRLSPDLIILDGFITISPLGGWAALDCGKTFSQLRIDRSGG